MFAHRLGADTAPHQLLAQTDLPAARLAPLSPYHPESSVNEQSRITNTIPLPDHLSGTLGLSLGFCGGAIVVWTRPVCNVRGAHCTLVWRHQGFNEQDLGILLHMRSVYLTEQKICHAAYSRVTVDTQGGPLGMHDPTKVRYNVAPTCGLYRFVKYVRKHVPKDWTSNISDPVVHITMKRPDNTGNGSSTASNDDSRAGVGCNHPSLYCHCKPHWSFWGWWCHDCSNTGRLKNYNITEDGGETCLRIGRHAEIKYKTIASGPDLGYSLWISNIWVDQGHRRAGIGRCLVQCVQHLRQKMHLRGFIVVGGDRTSAWAEFQNVRNFWEAIQQHSVCKVMECDHYSQIAGTSTFTADLFVRRDSG